MKIIPGHILSFIKCLLWCNKGETLFKTICNFCCFFFISPFVQHFLVWRVHSQFLLFKRIVWNL